MTDATLNQVTISNDFVLVGHAPDGTPITTRLFAMLIEILQQPRPGGITIDKMDRYLPIIRDLREFPDAGLWVADIEDFETLCAEVRAFHFARVDENVRNACRKFLSSKERQDGPSQSDP